LGDAITDADLLGADDFADLVSPLADGRAFFSLDVTGFVGALLMGVPVVFVSILETA
jgi:hypothetical protein